ncbi:MAG: heavy metal-responsive transcriptional regulator [Verrucomicrobia subdivision 3 bacterium]|nr:heavy metal-responsive transcriptional regulator [Limisphaerales bacterium]
MDKTWLIGQLAHEVGVKADTVRFYEKAGLLKKPLRTRAGYRLYDRDALNQLRFIKQAQSLGFSLQEIKRILTLRGAGRTTCRCVLGIAEATLSETEQKLTELQKFRDALLTHVERWKRQTKTGGKMVAEFCALIESSVIAPSQAIRPKQLAKAASNRS